MMVVDENTKFCIYTHFCTQYGEYTKKIKLKRKKNVPHPTRPYVFLARVSNTVGTQKESWEK